MPRVTCPVADLLKLAARRLEHDPRAKELALAAAQNAAEVCRDSDECPHKTTCELAAKRR